MSDEPQNQDSTENTSPPSPQEPTEATPIHPSTSDQHASIPVAPESPREADSAVAVNNPSDAEAMAGRDISQSVPAEPVLYNGTNEENGTNGEAQTAQTILVEPLNKPNVTIEKKIDGITITEVMSPPTSGQPTAQMAGSEPLISEQNDSEKRMENLTKANFTRQNKKRKKIESILSLFNEKQTVTNDNVEKLLHVSDATATRYLSILEKEGKIKQEGRTGQSVSYSRI